MRMFKMPSPGGGGFPKMAIVAIATLILMLLAALLASKLDH
jgi:hypothetical protein